MLTTIASGFSRASNSAETNRRFWADQWVRQFQTGLPNQGADTVLEGNVLQYDISGAAPRPVAHASCWNSIHPSGPHADPNTNLIP